MPFVHGSKGYFTITDSGGTVRDLSPYLTSTTLGRDVDSAETTTMGATGKTFIPGLTGATFGLEGRWDATVMGWLEGIIGVDARSFVYGPAGSTTGNRKLSGSCFLTGLEQTGALGDPAGWSADGQISGAVTAGVF